MLRRAALKPVFHSDLRVSPLIRAAVSRHAFHAEILFPGIFQARGPAGVNRFLSKLFNQPLRFFASHTSLLRVESVPLLHQIPRAMI
jgi:hypothetical protein